MRSTILLAGLLASAAQAATLPPAVGAMIDAAAADPEQLKVVAAVARKTNPDAVAEIDARVAAFKTKAAAAERARLAMQSWKQGWSGSVDVSATLSSGNTRTAGLAASAEARKSGLRWEHQVKVAANYQRDSGRTTGERYAAGYDTKYKVSKRLYAAAQLTFERDSFAGYSSRFSEGVGVGYRLLAAQPLLLDIEAGPALRETRFLDDRDEIKPAARLAADLAWQIAPKTRFTEQASAYLASHDTTLTSSTALTVALTGGLSAKASFNVIDESDPDPGRRSTDTNLLFGLLYSF